MFRFYLHNGNQYYRVNASGNVTTTSVPSTISTPDGWEQIDVSWGRNIDYWGVFRSLTTPLKFVEDGAKILRYLYYDGGSATRGIEAQCTFTVEIQNQNTLGWSLFYSGDIDFSQFNGEDFFVTTNAIESGLKKYLDAYGDTNFAIELSAADTTRLLLDGIFLQSNTEYIPIEDKLEGRSQTNGFIQLCKSFAFIMQEGSYEAVYPRQTARIAPMIDAVPITSVGQRMSAASHALFYAECLTTVMIERVTVIENVQIALNSGSSPIQFRVRFLAVDGNLAVMFSKVIYTHPSMISYTNEGTNVSINISNEIGAQMQQGWRYYLAYEFDTLNTSGSRPVMLRRFAVQGNPENKIVFNTKFFSSFRLRPSECRGYRIGQLFDKICRAMSNGTGGGVTPELSNPSYQDYDSIPSQLLFTSGDSLRGLTSPQPPAIWTSFNQFFKAVSNIYSLGMGIFNGAYRLSPISFFLDKDSVIADLGEVSDLQVSPAKEYLYNNLSIGYDDQDYDEVNGRDEFNTKHEYKFPISSVTGNKEMVCPYRTDMYGIETYRANLTQKTTTDNSTDNDTFIIETNNVIVNGAVSIRRPGFTISGLIYPQSAYNISLSPKRNMYRNMRLIASTCNGIRSGTITYQISKKNNSLVSSRNSVTVVEKSNVGTNSMPSPLFIPILFRFRCTPPDNIAALMATNPRGCFKFAWQGNTYKGFPMTVGTKPATYDSYNMTLLCTPDTDITKLIS